MASRATAQKSRADRVPLKESGMRTYLCIRHLPRNLLSIGYSIGRKITRGRGPAAPSWGKIRLRTAYRVRKNIRANRMLMIQVPTLISLILPVKIFTKT